MGTAWFYDHTPERAKADYEAVRTKAGLMDVSGLKKVHVIGADAAYVIDRVTTRNVEKIAPGRSTYASILNSEGKFIDDCIIYHLSVNSWLVVHGTGTGMEQLAAAAAGKNCEILFDDDLHDMSLQGPVSVDLLAKEIPAIRDLAYFGLMQTRLYGRDVMISRTGYTGERGYEIETCGDTLWELGLDFTVSPGKEGFVGAENHYASKGKERFKIYGVQLSDSMDQMEMHARVMHEGKDVGVITYGLSSELNNYSVAIARLSPEVAKAGTKLTVVQPDGTELAATAEEMPFYDKDKSIRTAKG